MTAEQCQHTGAYVDQLSQVERKDILFQERSLLGTLLANPECYTELADFLEPVHFYDGFHGRIFEQFSISWRANIHSYPKLVHNLLGDPTAEALGVSVSEYLADLIANNSLIAMQVRQVGKIVYENWYKLEVARRAQLFATLTKERGSLPELEPPPMSPDMIEPQTGHRVTDRGSPFGTVCKQVNDVFRDGAVPDRFMLTRLTDLDRRISGLMRGRYYSLAGRPAMGKTTVATALMLNLASHGHGCVYFSLEMTSEEIATRLLSDACRRQGKAIPYKKIEQCEHISESDLVAIIGAQERLDRLPIHIHDAAGLTVLDMQGLAAQERVKMAQGGQKLDVVFIDHMGLTKPSGTFQNNKVAETESVSNALKVMAKELDVAVVSLVQLNRGTEGREDKKPTLADLRWSGAIEQDSDVVMFVYRESYYHGLKGDDLMQAETLNALELIIAKNRSGDTGPVKLFVDTPCAFVGNLEVHR